MPKTGSIQALFVAIWLLFSFGLISQTDQYKFRHLTTKDGLSSHDVYCMTKDSRGFMWFGTSRGLSRFDGNDFKVFRFDPGDSTSLNNNAVSSLLEETNEDLLIGTYSGGLNRFHFATEKFTHYINDPDNPKSISHDRVNVIYRDNENVIWIGTHNGLNMFDPLTGTFRVYKQDPLNPGNKKNQINTIYHDNNGILWIGTNDGLYQFNHKHKTFKLIELILPVEPLENRHKVINCITEDYNGVLWIGTDYLLFKYYNGKYEWVSPDKNIAKRPSNYFIHDFLEDKDVNGYHFWIATSWGLNKYDFKSGLYERIHVDPDNQESLTSEQTNDLLLDENGMLFIAGPDGVDVLDLNPNPFHQVFVPLGRNTISYSAITFYEDEERNFWIGSANGGLLKYDQDLNPIKRFKFLLNKRHILNHSVFKIFEDSKQNMWIGMNRPYAGFYLFDRVNESFTKLEYSSEDGQPLPTETKDILESKAGIVWFATNKGLYRFIRHNQETFSLRPAGDELLSNTWISDLYNDQSGNTWIASREGLYQINEINHELITFTKIDDCHSDQSCLQGKPMCIFESKDGTFWVGTTGGLFIMNTESHVFTEVYGQNELIGENIILSIVEDNKGYLWMNTWKGIVRFNPGATSRESPKLFDISDGLPYEGYISTPLFKSNDGRIFVPGRGARQNGFYYFHPDSICFNTRIPTVMITDIKISNKSYDPDSSITLVKHIELSYKQNHLSFEFAALDYSDPAKNQYAYQLTGVDEDWTYSGNRRFANYSALPPGDYIFRVKGSNNDGYWNETGTSIAITILPPPWKTWWSYMLYGVFIISILFSMIYYYLRRQQLIHKLKIEHIEAEKLKELDSMKSRFFANISHEFRTPLTLILGPLQKMIGKPTSATDKKDLTVMQRNARRLQELINQLLDLSKLEAGKMKLQCSELNIVEWARTYIQSFESLARQRKIDVIFSSEQPEIKCWFDPEKMMKVLNNLLSNAFKFTKTEGKIIVFTGSAPTADYEGPWVNLSISDTGTGIPSEKLPHIFERFYQADESQTRKYEGTGIGLAMVKELVELHHGNITVESTEGEGTTFTILLPLGKEHLKPEEIIESPISETIEALPAGQMEEELVGCLSEKEQIQIEEENGLPVMLIVEDNADMQNYIRGFFIESYQIMETVNGQKGFDLAIQHIPDIIVSDVMMPVMDGYQLCRKIKTDERTSHIPVILLTARSSGADKIEGLETGADDFITKPFEGNELKVRVRNLINQRERLRKIFGKKIAFSTFKNLAEFKDSGIASMDEKFLKKAFEIVEREMPDPEFSVLVFSNKIGLSRMQLHRKLKALTDQSPSEFIKILRLNKAAVLLKSKSATSAEIAYDVGFNSPSYFSTCFKEHFGKTPLEFAEEN